jgi:ParB family chromosome partitioning protein
MMINVLIDTITPNPYQPRSEFNEESIDILCSSITKYGIIEPIVLRPRRGGGYEIITGERRFRAARKIGLKEVPAVVRNSTDSEMLEIAMIENLHREDMSPIDKAKGFKRLINEFRYTQNQISHVMGMSRSAVANTIRLLDLPQSIQYSLHKKEITEGHARALLCIKDQQSREVALKRVIVGEMSVRETEVLSRLIEKSIKSSSRNQNLDFEIAELRLIEELQEKLGTRVHIAKNGIGGKIEIEFYSDEDLQRIIESL